MKSLSTQMALTIGDSAVTRAVAGFAQSAQLFCSKNFQGDFGPVVPAQIGTGAHLHSLTIFLYLLELLSEIQKNPITTRVCEPSDKNISLEYCIAPSDQRHTEGA